MTAFVLCRKSIRKIIAIVMLLQFLPFVAQPLWAALPMNTPPDIVEQHALEVIENACATLAASSLQPGEVPALLPPEATLFTEALQRAAQHDGSTKDKAKILVDSLGFDCSQLLSITVIALVVDLFNIIPFDHVFVQLLAALTVLCYLGVV